MGSLISPSQTRTRLIAPTCGSSIQRHTTTATIGGVAQGTISISWNSPSADIFSACPS